jgi:hypothetical protein
VKTPFKKSYLLEGVHIMVQLGIHGMRGTIITICEICKSFKQESERIKCFEKKKFLKIFHKELHFSKFKV